MKCKLCMATGHFGIILCNFVAFELVSRGIPPPFSSILGFLFFAIASPANVPTRTVLGIQLIAWLLLLFFNVVNQFNWPEFHSVLTCFDVTNGERSKVEEVNKLIFISVVFCLIQQMNISFGSS